MAKRFDIDGNGVLDPQEREIAKRVLAEEFFKRNVNSIQVDYIYLHLISDIHRRRIFETSARVSRSARTKRM